MCVCVRMQVCIDRLKWQLLQSGCSMRREVLDSTESHAVRM